MAVLSARQDINLWLRAKSAALLYCIVLTILTLYLTNSYINRPSAFTYTPSSASQQNYIPTFGKSSSSRPDPKADDGLEPRQLHLLVPVSKPDVNLCKTAISAQVLGYPSPFLVNWNVTFDNKDLVDGGSHLGKISGMHKYLQKLGHTRDEDLILMVDGYDIWFQLKPQILIDRWHEINRKADARNLKKYGAEAAENMKQQIVFSAQKRCAFWDEAKDAPCNVVPESTLSEDIYGPNTDKYGADNRERYQKMRQRFINSGVALGTVAAMRSFLADAEEIANVNKNFGSDQKIFGQLFGQQETRRRKLTKSGGWEAMKMLKTEHNIEMNDKDYGFGLDYESQLSIATVFAEEDTEWIRHNGTALLRAQMIRGIPNDQHRIHSLQMDIAQSLPPYWTPSLPGIHPEVKWEDVPLLTNLYTGVIPVIMHHNAHRDGMKSLRKTWWPRLWFQKNLQTFFEVAKLQPSGPLAFSGGRYWWPNEHTFGDVVHIHDNKANRWRPIPLHAICTPEHFKEVFRNQAINLPIWG